MHTMQVISQINAHLPQQFISSMVPSFPGAPINSLKHPEAVQMQKQEQCTQQCYIKTG